MPTKLESLEIETRVVAALTALGCYTKLKVQEAMFNLSEACFTFNDTRKTYLIIRKLFDLKQEFSIVSLLSHLPDDLFLFMNEFIRDEYVSTNCLGGDVKTLNDLNVLRKQKRILDKLSKFSEDSETKEQASDAIQQGIQELHDVTKSKPKSYVRSYEQIADEMLQEGEGENSSEFCINIQGIPPVPNKALIIIAGRSGHGKTFFGLHLMDKIIDVKPGKQTLYFNLEMHEHVMMERHASLIGIKGATRYKTIEKALPVLLGKNVSLISEPMISIEQIEAECRIASLRQPLAVVVVDYLGLIQNKKKHERNDLEQSNIAKRLAALSLELDCVVIALTQVNRENKARQVGDKCPIPTDSSESMGSVHSASWWIGIDQPQLDSTEEHFKHLFQVRCRKNRGESGPFKLDLEFKDGQFLPWVRPYSYEPAKKGPATF